MRVLRTMVKQIAVATLLVVSQRIAIRVVDKVASKLHRSRPAGN